MSLNWKLQIVSWIFFQLILANESKLYILINIFKYRSKYWHNQTTDFLAIIIVLRNLACMRPPNSG
jgi:hypothetical protein